MMETNTFTPNGISNNPPSNVSANRSNNMRLGVVIFTIVCILVAALLAGWKWWQSTRNSPAPQPQVLIDPLARQNPTEAVKIFLADALQSKYWPKESIMLRPNGKNVYQYNWSDGDTFYTARILMVDPVESTNSGQANVGMIILGVRLQSDQPITEGLARNYAEEYFNLPGDLLRSIAESKTDDLSGVGQTVAWKWQDSLGSRQWVGLIENPPHQKGPIYIYSLQMCRMFPGIANYANYRCLVNPK